MQTQICIFMKVLGNVEHILGIRIRWIEKERYYLCPKRSTLRRYWKEFRWLIKAIFITSSTTSKAFKSTLAQRQRGNKKKQAIPYYLACGSLIYALVSTWPGIAYVVVSIFMSKLGRNYRPAVKSIARYPKASRKNAFFKAKGTSMFMIIVILVWLEM